MVVRPSRRRCMRIRRDVFHGFGFVRGSFG